MLFLLNGHYPHPSRKQVKQTVGRTAQQEEGNMEILSVAIMYVSGVWASVYLILNDHPWFGAFILIGTFSIRYTSRPTKRAPDARDSAE